MPRTQITVNSLTRAGVAPVTEVAADATNFNFVVNDGKTWLEVTNSGGNTETVTLRVKGTVDGQAVTPKVVSLATTVKRKIGPFPVALYGPQVEFDCSHAGITVAAYRLP